MFLALAFLQTVGCFQPAPPQLLRRPRIDDRLPGASLRGWHRDLGPNSFAGHGRLEDSDLLPDQNRRRRADPRNEARGSTGPRG